MDRSCEEFEINSKKYGIRKVLIDKEDWEKIKDFKWHIFGGDKILYIANSKTRNLLHRLIMNCPDDKFIDHINHNTFDNRKCNLRVCNLSENAMNRNKKGEKIKGVTWNKKNKKYKAYIYPDGKYTHLGYFESETEAAKVYNQAAVFYFGDFARLNIIIEVD